MTTPTTKPDHCRRLAKRLAFSVVLGFMSTLALCLLFSYRSSAQERTQWQHILVLPERLSSVRLDRSLGKTMLQWAPLRGDHVTAFQRSGGTGLGDLKVGNEAPPVWSAFWDDEQFRAADPSLDKRYEIAVGWPWRAFRCMYVTHRPRLPIPTPPIGGWFLPTAVVDRGPTDIVGEIRAVPFLPIWSGLLLNILTCAAGAFALLSLIALRPRAVNIPARPGRPRLLQRPSRAGVLVCAVLGICTSVATAVVLPMALRSRIVRARCTTQPYTYETRDLFWKHRTIHYLEGEHKISASNAREFDAELARLEFSTDPSRHKRGPRDDFDAGGPAAFISTETGWPFTCLWGARWHTIGIQPMRETLNLVEVPKSRWQGWAINRELTSMPTRPLPLGWILNTLIFSLVWLGVLMILGGARRRRRHRRGLCPFCAYDRRATPPDSPCPECGRLAAVTLQRHTAPTATEQ